MKNLIIILLVAIAFSCAYEPNVVNMWHDFDFDHDINSIEEAERWVKDNIRYKSEKGDYWRTPAETLKKGYGDCEDMSILIIGIAYRKLGIKARILLTDTTGDGLIDHACAEYKGKRYYGLSGRIIRTYGFDEIPNKVQYTRPSF